MVSRYRDKINQSYCLVKVDKKGWILGKRTGERIFITEKDGNIVNICTTTDMDRFRNFQESIEFESKKVLNVGDKVKLDSFEPYFVVDAGYRGDDGEVRYLIAR